MKIALGADHAGFALKEELKRWLEENGHTVFDYGATDENPDDDYPDFILPAARAVAMGEADRALVLGSSGQGEGIAANRLKGVRALVYYGPEDPLLETHKTGVQKDLITVSREDNDSNVLALGASFVSLEEAQEVVTRWLETPFTGEERHIRRIKKLDI
ncbi:MAG: RpiB/LacA/LacB family sugar-phosphate isomerase [Candidatus Pacebacteria bacterium]|nr:RpiB/LacA/LacB family sugar-phosphate isomerase [Candidatus Paceibacterota bacterium]